MYLWNKGVWDARLCNSFAQIEGSTIELTVLKVRAVPRARKTVVCGEYREMNSQERTSLIG
jgi:hypothetical protein